MKRLTLAILLVFCLIGVAGCNNDDDSVQVSKTQVSSANSINKSKEKESAQVSETSKPPLFEREEQSLSPVTSDNIVDMNGGATSEQQSNIEVSDKDEKPYNVGEKTRAQEFLDKIKESKKYVFTCGEVKITRNGDEIVWRYLVLIYHIGKAI